MSRGWPQNAEKDAKNGDANAQLFMAYSMFNNGNTDGALKWYKEAAKQGNPEGICNAASLYLHTRNHLNIVEGCKWMETYLNSNHPEKDPSVVQKYLFEYGSYLIGAKTSASIQPQQELPMNMQNAKKGCELLERAGEIFNDSGAIDLLGSRLYMTGQHKDIPQDLDKGMYWLLKGAQNGNGHNAFQLAMTYTCGLIPVNPELEEKWLEVAVKLGYHEANGMLQMARKKIGRKEAKKRVKNIDKEKKIDEFLTTDETTKCSNSTCSNKETDGKKFSACSICKQAKYCCKECQIQHWKEGGHKDKCKILKQSKDRLLGYNRNLCILEARICFNPTCCKSEPRGEKFKQCSRCKAAIYCSQSCQKAHFKAGHKKVCKSALNYLEEAEKMLEKLK